MRSFKTEYRLCVSEHSWLTKNTRKLRQPLIHLDSPDVVNHPSGAPRRIKQKLKIICSSKKTKKHLDRDVYASYNMGKFRKDTPLWLTAALTNIWTVLMRWTPPIRCSLHDNSSDCDGSPSLFQSLWVEWRTCRWSTPQPTPSGSAGSRPRATSGSTRSSTSPPPEEPRPWLVFSVGIITLILLGFL